MIDEWFLLLFSMDSVPPKQMKILDEKGNEVDDVIGPFDEDSTLTLVCLVVGGRPHIIPFPRLNIPALNAPFINNAISWC